MLTLTNFKIQNLKKNICSPRKGHLKKNETTLIYFKNNYATYSKKHQEKHSNFNHK